MAAGFPEVAITQARAGRAEEDAIQDVAGVSLESNIPALSEVRVLVDREIFVVISKPADVLILSRRIAEGKLSRVGPCRCIQISVLVRVAEASRQRVGAADFVGILGIVKEVPAEVIVRHRNR